MAPTLKDAERYVGVPYEVGVFDCADLAARVQRELFGRDIQLPVHRARPGGARGQAREIRALQGELAERIELPDTGCAVLMYEQDEPAPLWHVGTVFLHAGDTWVLHNSHKLGSAALHRLSDLRRWGMRVDGFYAWKVAP